MRQWSDTFCTLLVKRNNLSYTLPLSQRFLKIFVPQTFPTRVQLTLSEVYCGRLTIDACSLVWQPVRNSFVTKMTPSRTSTTRSRWWRQAAPRNALSRAWKWKSNWGGEWNLSDPDAIYFLVLLLRDLACPREQSLFYLFTYCSVGYYRFSSANFVTCLHFLIFLSKLFTLTIVLSIISVSWSVFQHPTWTWRLGFYHVQRLSSTNSMNAYNLAVCIAPSIMSSSMNMTMSQQVRTCRRSA